MSKKKGKPAAKQPSKKAPMMAARRTAKKPMAKSRSSARRGPERAEDAGRTLTVTIFLFRTNNGNRIRTSPQRIYANPGDRISWTVVNLIDGNDVPVTITWPERGPWGKESIQIKSWTKEPVGSAEPGRYKYVVSALDAQEDPEIEIPEGN